MSFGVCQKLDKTLFSWLISLSLIRGDSPTSSAWQARQGESRDHYFLVAPCKGIGIPESGKFSLVESGVLGFGIRDTGQGIRNPTYDWNPEQVPLTKA